MCPFLTRRQTDLITLMFGPSEFIPKMPSQSFPSLWIQTDEQSGLWDAHGYGKRFVVRADEKLTAFVELEAAIHQYAVDLIR